MLKDALVAFHRSMTPLECNDDQKIWGKETETMTSHPRKRGLTKSQKDLVEAFKARRISLGMTQSQVVKATGIAADAVSRFENGIVIPGWNRMIVFFEAVGLNFKLEPDPDFTPPPPPKRRPKGVNAKVRDSIPGTLRHGTEYAFSKKGCSCDLCTAAHVVAVQRRRALPRPPIPPEGDPRHGKVSTYEYYRCRCDLCMAASRARHGLITHPKPKEGTS